MIPNAEITRTRITTTNNPNKPNIDDNLLDISDEFATISLIADSVKVEGVLEVVLQGCEEEDEEEEDESIILLDESVIETFEGKKIVELGWQTVVAIKFNEDVVVEDVVVVVADFNLMY